MREGKAEAIQPSITVSWGGRWYGAWGDGESPLRFAARPQDAPILHVGGPLEMGFESRWQHSFARKDKQTFELAVGVGTKGLGKGSFTYLTYWDDAIPKDAQPTAELEFPRKQPGGPPVKVKLVLKERCWSCRFHDTVRVPEEVGRGDARITLSYPSWPKGNVAPAVFKLPVPE
jgi:hypothetical protein